jgi:hypothetical protein
MQLADLRNKRDERLTQMWDALKRVRATVKGVYGDDSSEYKLVGGNLPERAQTPCSPPAGVSTVPKRCAGRRGWRWCNHPSYQLNTAS